MVNMSVTNQNTPRLTTNNQNQIPSTRSTIDEFREIVREQSFVLPTNSSNEPDQVDIRVKKYPPLPDISGGAFSAAANTFYRTESSLTNSQKSVPAKKQMFYHFARTQRAHLPSLNPNLLPPSVSNVMDLDENLPECYNRVPNRVQTYTSPNDRLSSPIKRPSAPSPPASAQIKRPGQNSFLYRNNDENEDDDDDEIDSESDELQSQLFQENFYQYESSSSNRRFPSMNQNHQQNNLLILDDPSSSFSALDLHG